MIGTYSGASLGLRMSELHGQIVNVFLSKQVESLSYVYYVFLRSMWLMWTLLSGPRLVTSHHICVLTRALHGGRLVSVFISCGSV